MFTITHTSTSLAASDSVATTETPTARGRRTRRGLFVSALALMMATGCVAEMDLDESSVESTHAALLSTGEGAEVATVTTSEGTVVSFVSGAEDELGIAVIGTIGRTDEVLDRAEREAGGDPIKFFELLSGSAAPRALRDAVAATNSGAFPIDASDDGEFQIPSGTADFKDLSQASLLSSLCSISNWAHSGSGKFMYCWPNQYSTPWVKRKVDHMSCRFDSVSGPQRVRYRYKSGSNWHTSIDVWLSSGQYMQWTGYYQWAKRWRECKTVDNPSSRKHHFRVVGHEWLTGLAFNPVSVSFPSP